MVANFARHPLTSFLFQSSSIVMICLLMWDVAQFLVHIHYLFSSSCILEGKYVFVVEEKDLAFIVEEKGMLNKKYNRCFITLLL